MCSYTLCVLHILLHIHASHEQPHCLISCVDMNVLFVFLMHLQKQALEHSSKHYLNIQVVCFVLLELLLCFLVGYIQTKIKLIV